MLGYRQSAACLIGIRSVRIGFQHSRVLPGGFVPFAESFVALAGLQRRGGLPLGIGVKDFHGQVLAECLVESLLVEKGFGCHEAGHGRRFGFAARRRLPHFAVVGPGPLEVRLRGQVPADDIVGFVLLGEVGEARFDLGGDFGGALPLVLLGQHLGAAQEDQRCPRWAVLVNLLGQFFQSRRGFRQVAQLEGRFGDPVLSAPARSRIGLELQHGLEGLSRFLPTPFGRRGLSQQKPGALAERLVGATLQDGTGMGAGLGVIGPLQRVHSAPVHGIGPVPALGKLAAETCEDGVGLVGAAHIVKGPSPSIEDRVGARRVRIGFHPLLIHSRRPLVFAPLVVEGGGSQQSLAVLRRPRELVQDTVVQGQGFLVASQPLQEPAASQSRFGGARGLRILLQELLESGRGRLQVT